MTHPLDTTMQLPRQPRPICVIGTGAIVSDAHLPAYQKAEWPVTRIVDLDPQKARQVADRFGIPTVANSVDELIRQVPADAVFDVAVPASALAGLLPKLPEKATVMIQKPFGETIAEARHLLRICRERQFTASVNMQMKCIRAVIAAKNLIDRGVSGNRTTWKSE